MSGSSRPVRMDDFFLKMPRRAIVVFHAAVFCIFAPVGLLFVSSLDPQRGWLPVFVNLVVSGLIAVSWAATFTVSRWFIAAIVFFNLLMMALNTALADSPIGIGGAAPSLLGFGLIAAIVLGYSLFVAFISGQGRTTVRLMTEMSLARTIHDTLVPALRFANERIEAVGLSFPSTEMGGDLIDVIERDACTDLFVADVSGHGVKAGVVMGMVKSAIRMGLCRPVPGPGHGDLSDLLRDLNSVLESTTSAELYATLAALRIDRDGGLQYALAGHHHIVHIPAAGSEVRRLGERAYPLGLLDDRTYETRAVALGAGDLLAIYTDGLNETTDASERELGHEPIESLLVRLAARPLDEIRDAVFALVARHGAQADDRTLLLVRFRG